MVAEGDAARLKEAIDGEDLALVQALMESDKELHQAPLGYGKDGPLTWVAECRVPWRAPSETRLAMARWMIANGSDVHQGGDGPLMRAALNSDRIPMMELLVELGADVNARWHGHYPIIHAACETLDPESLRWLLKHGAEAGDALDYTLATYVRAPEELRACLQILMDAGAVTECPAIVVALVRGEVDVMKRMLGEDAGYLTRQFPEIDFGSTARRRLTLRGATLLHVAAEYGEMDAARLLLDCGCDVNARAASGQTAIFHAATQFDDKGLPMVELLMERGADLSIRANLPGQYDRPDEFIECTALEYAARFPGSDGEASLTVRRMKR